MPSEDSHILPLSSDTDQRKSNKISIANKPEVISPVPDSSRNNALQEFDELIRKQKPNVDKAKILKSAYHQSLLRVSWNLIESEILHSPGWCWPPYEYLPSLKYFFPFTDSFDMGYDIQQYFALHQSLTLEDLARANSRHTLNGLMRVVSKVLQNCFHNNKIP